VVAQGAWADLLRSRRRDVPGGVGSDVEHALALAPARDDLAAQLEANDDRELFDLAAGRVRGRVEPQTWEAFRLTALEGRSRAEAAAALGMQVTGVFKAKSRVQQMLRDEVALLEGGGD